MNLPQPSNEFAFFLFLFIILGMSGIMLYDYYKGDKKKVK